MPSHRRAIAHLGLCLIPLANSYAQAPSRSTLTTKLDRCELPGVNGLALCGKLEVPESRERATSRRISLNVVVLPATTDSVSDDPVVFLAGGGVVPATRFAGFLSRALPNLRRRRDVLLVDQRGTWGSNPLPCDIPVTATPVYGGDAAAAVRRCRDSLSSRADLAAYTTPNAVADLEDVREWLGYRRVSLYGVSYGTKVAQVYVRSHPEHVRAAALHGVVALPVAMQLDLARSAQATLAVLFQRCSLDGPCRAAFPRLSLELDSLLQRLRVAPAQVSLTGPDGSPRAVAIGERTLRDFIQAMLGSARAIERLPLLIHSAYAGDFTPMARAIVGEGPPPPPGPPRGVFLSIICSEAIPQIRAESVDSATRGTFFGDAPVRSQMRLCDDWPRGRVPADFWQPVRGDTPVLAISGELDPITPPRYGELVASGFTRGRHLVVPNRSHNDVDPCITSLLEQFLIAGDANAVDTKCITAPAPLRFATELSSRPRE